LSQYRYSPYGQRFAMLEGVPGAFGFTGHFSHASSGLSLALFRAYNSETGRCLSRDPIGETGGLNLYGYVGANPINMIDPAGLFRCLEEEQGLSQEGGLSQLGDFIVGDAIDAVKEQLEKQFLNQFAQWNAFQQLMKVTSSEAAPIYKLVKPFARFGLRFLVLLEWFDIPLKVADLLLNEFATPAY